jgi:hypothetical protein
MTGLRMAEIGEYHQGFLTNQNCFVSRKEAWEIAIATNTLKSNVNSDTPRDLFSEDIY